jgi:hypothetical protein
MGYQLGKLPPKHDDRNLRLGTYLTVDLPKAPPKVETYKRVALWPMMKNDELGDCTIAGAGHMIQDWTAACGREVIPADSAILDAYWRVAEGRDGGAVMLDVLKMWRKRGIANHRILAFAELDHDSKGQLQHAIHLFGAAYLGLALPDYAVRNDPLKTPWTHTGDAPPNPQNGHCVCAVGYGPTSIYVVTWGKLKPMSYAFYRKYNDESYACLSRDWINAMLGTSPLGFDLQTLQADLVKVARA